MAWPSRLLVPTRRGNGMRAIIKSSGTTGPTELDKVLVELGWWPTLSQDHEEVKVRAEEILAHVSRPDHALAAQTLLFTIYDAESRTWGIVSNPTHGQLTFRLKNSSSERLKYSCERLVGQLQTTFLFSPKIEILEPNSEDHAFHGSILEPRRLVHAIRERKREALVGLFALALAVLLLSITSPIVSDYVFHDTLPQWRTWIAGNLERFTTAAMVAVTLLWFEVGMHWVDLRRRPVIRWELE